MRRLGEAEGRAVRAAIAKQRPMTPNVVPADDDLVELPCDHCGQPQRRHVSICGAGMVCPISAVTFSNSKSRRIASLSSELARCRNALEEEPTEAEIEACVSFIYGLDHNLGETSERRADLETLRADLRDMLKAMRSAALNPIGEEGAREP
jgi:hypothetical protein